jgi:hypothetical protein
MIAVLSWPYVWFLMLLPGKATLGEPVPQP